MSITDVTLVTGLRPTSRSAAARGIAVRHQCFHVDEARQVGDAAVLSICDDCIFDRVVLELRTDASIESTIGMLDEATGVTVVEHVCVIDADTFFDDILDDEYHSVIEDGVPVHVARALRMVQHIEHASTLLVTSWEQVETRDLSVLLALLSHLAPTARLRLDRASPEAPPSAFTAEGNQPGWVHLLNGEHRPHMRDMRVSAFRYEQLRPFHPERLHRTLDKRFGEGEFGAILRSAGFCRLATRPGVVGSWNQVGQMISLEPLARDDLHIQPLLALGQDIGIIGIDLDHARLTSALDAATMSDAEFAGTTSSWSELADPFPRWITTA